MRPLLLPALRRLWRDRSTVQLGLDPARAVLVTGLPAGAAELFDRLDGMTDLDAVLAAADRSGLDRDLAAELINLLVRAGAVVDAAGQASLPPGLAAPARQRLAPDAASLALLGRDAGGVLAARSSRMVAVYGSARLAVPIAATLAAAGVGRVHVSGREPLEYRDVAPAGICAADLALPRPGAASAAILRVAPEADTRPLPPRRPADLVVLAGPAVPGAPLVDRMLSGGVAHLAVAVRETAGVVGPLVRPGTTSCLRCVDLHRGDRDPVWPALVAQLATAPPARVDAQDTALGTMIAGLAALQALSFLDGEPVQADNGTLELALPDCLVRRRSWPPHPRCRCRSPGLGRVS